MSEPGRPYTPETLSERWSCSSQHIRDLVGYALTGAEVSRRS